MTYTIPPALHAILADADRVAPGRSHASDGTIGDAAHRAEVSDHNPAPGTGIVHAVDVTNDPAHGMDTWWWAQVIAARIISGVETRVKYLVSNNGTHDVIFNPSVSLTWRPNNAEGGQSHRSHLHTSILSGAAVEESTAPYFVGGPVVVPPAPPPNPEDDDDMSASRHYPIDGFFHDVWIPTAGPHAGQLEEHGPKGATNLSVLAGIGEALVAGTERLYVDGDLLRARAQGVSGTLWGCDYVPGRGWGSGTVVPV